MGGVGEAVPAPVVPGLGVRVGTGVRVGVGVRVGTGVFVGGKVFVTLVAGALVAVLVGVAGVAVVNAVICS